MGRDLPLPMLTAGLSPALATARLPSIAELVRSHNNDYSRFEPFFDPTPIATSIVIPCYNHEALLLGTLRNLSQHPELLAHPDKFEIIVVDDGSPQPLAELLKKEHCPCSLKILRQDFNQGAAAARNLGLQLASGELVLFIDSDVRLPNGYFAAQWRVHNAVPQAVTVGLAENLAPEDPRSQKPFDYSWQPDTSKDFRASNSSVYRDFPLNKTVRFLDESQEFRHFEKAFSGSPWTLSEMVVGHNIGVRRTHALAIGGFDLRFSNYGSEDTFFGSRLIANGAFVVPLMNTGVFRTRHAPRKNDSNQQLVDSVKAAFRRVRIEQDSQP
ncbi:MAG: glycosyltransferase family 2 protein [Oligoflexia bacterium]|nr:glycosyltransferase family 2 protein [Oligoflexia bacterium]